MENTNIDYSSSHLAILLIIVFFLYIGAVITSNRKSHLRKWPFIRCVFWFFGILSVALSLLGPVASQAHMNFSIHMAGHILLGMLAPMLIVLAAPVTLLLRSLPVSGARRVAQLLRKWPIRLISHPVVATILNIGGLWLLYTTDLYMMMHHNLLLHIIIHVHVFLAGYVFTASIIYIEPTAHRYSFIYRSIVLLLALAGHGILSKYIYASPPDGVPRTQGETGAMIMYYGGDLIDIILIFILCQHWYRATRPRLIQQTQSFGV
ncbi:putative membrane protein [Gracilibacillus ureilyticus]|uniref:Putative membrane protein n=1 Tax=Gracilibacillus ureilyticus TaxID=531814 RepID=A0A1H9NAE7_9BACI|nr:cytochrome c oxidase assembly protein [Gracilibacillus ureilyticus]SER32781.1 putative membrane protein [Gracilibacillus ureilyticus]